MKKIRLTKGQFAVVDDSDYEYLKKIKWHAIKPYKIWYAATHGPKINGKWTHIYMHRHILKAQNGFQIDHKNRDGLDNRRENLRLCNNVQNSRNNSGWRNKKYSKYKGVKYEIRKGNGPKHWSARICMHSKTKHLGSFLSETEAAHTYDQAARSLFGEFAFLNFHQTNKQR